MKNTMTIGKKTAPQSLGSTQMSKARNINTVVTLKARSGDDFATKQNKNKANVKTTGGK